MAGCLVRLPTTMSHSFVRMMISKIHGQRKLSSRAERLSYQYVYRMWKIIVCGKLYSLHPEILVIEIDVSRYILVLDTYIFIHFDDKYFRTEGVQK